MKIRVGGEGEDRPVELEEVYATMGGGVHVIGHMAFGSAEKVYVLLDADTLAKLMRAAAGESYKAPTASDQNSD